MDTLGLAVKVRPVPDAWHDVLDPAAADQVPVWLARCAGEAGGEVGVANRRPRVLAGLRAHEADERAENRRAPVQSRKGKLAVHGRQRGAEPFHLGLVVVGGQGGELV